MHCLRYDNANILIFLPQNMRFFPFFSFKCLLIPPFFLSIGDSSGYHSPLRWQTSCCPDILLLLALRYFQRPLATSDMLPPFHVVSTSSFCQVNTGQRQFILIPRCGSPVFMSASCTSPTSPHAPPTCCHVDHVLIHLLFFY